MKKFFVVLSLIILHFWLLFAENGVNVNIIDGNTKSSISTDKSWLFNLLKAINEILWNIAIVLVFALFIYLGISLMKSEWNEEDMKKVKSVSKAMAIAIFVIMLSGAIIKIVVTLFE